MHTVPYTHWVYFQDREAAQRCADELAGDDFLVGIDAVEEDSPTLAELVASGQVVFAPGIEVPEEQLTARQPSWMRWLLRAAREVVVDDLIERHHAVEAVVVRHGGFYDGGETGWLDVHTGEPIRQADD